MLPDHPRALTVGAITDPSALHESFSINDCDLIELRLDALWESPSLRDFCERHAGQVPLLLTPRAKEEGGLREWDEVARKKIICDLLPFASAIDIELANWSSFAELEPELHERKIDLVLSSHDFKKFDHVLTVEHLAQAQSLGASIAKVAVHLEDALDLTLFESLAHDFANQPVSIMGMGAYGPASRLLAAQHGSRLNYGFLGAEATAPGQWPAKLLKEAIAHSPPL
ncbi:MAG: type I 3-dehydroquinate dehydratase [Verrucomicrobiota bacterium JB023]|nr:type I 3-dehydroquinate dehydratase [Verrucomicrobiota bacterium JB023]